MIYSEVQCMWSMLWYIYKEKMKDTDLKLLDCVSHQELSSLIDLVASDEGMDDEMKDMVATALINRDTSEARRLILGVIPY